MFASYAMANWQTQVVCWGIECELLCWRKGMRSSCIQRRRRSFFFFYLHVLFSGCRAMHRRRRRQSDDWRREVTLPSCAVGVRNGMHGVWWAAGFLCPTACRSEWTLTAATARRDGSRREVSHEICLPNCGLRRRQRCAGAASHRIATLLLITNIIPLIWIS